MAQSAKLIKTEGVSKKDPVGKWYDLANDIVPFIQGIKTGDLNIDEISSTLITGVPTPWARAKIFSFAFQYTTSNDPNIRESGLIDYFKMLVNEWKGLLALVALYSDRVSFSEPIYMNPNSKTYDLSGAFGRMLLEDADIWTDQTEDPNKNPNKLPHIQLITYKPDGKVIGGTSPFSIIFPGVEYTKLEHAKDIPWYRNGKFEDPMRYLANDKDKLQKLYLFINNIIGLTYTDRNGQQIARKGTILKFKENPNLSRQNNKLDLTGLEKVLSKWQDSIKKIDQNLQINGTVAKYSNLAMPYKAWLDSHQKVYQLKESGDFTFECPADETKIANELSDLQNILQDGGSVVGWFEAVDYQQPLSNAAVYYLPVNDVSSGQKKYFSLPLTLEAIQMFGQKIDNFISGNQRNMSIDASIKDNKLSVDLSVEIDGQPYKLNTKEYDIVWAEEMKKFGGDGKIMMWPDFISDNWNAYYLYSEFPLHNVQGLKFVPFYKRGQDQKIITANVGQGDKVVYSNSNEQERLQANLEITELVTYPANLANMPQYEVIKSNCPVAGLEIRIEKASNFENTGYLVVRNPNTTFGNRQIKDLTTDTFVGEATVGIDFGSNNSCAYYSLSIDSKEAMPIEFKNHRLALVGTDSTSRLEAEQDELLFFSNEFTPNGQIKSWLHEHDNRYVVNNEDKEIAGGVAVNEKNILVKEMTEYKITTQAGTLHYNMKWLSDKEGISKKTAYLKALWLSICADLYAEHYKPVAIRWSYPGSMSPSDKTNYNNIYSLQLPSLTPIFVEGQQLIIPNDNISEHTESEAVCRYALNQEESLENNCMFLGIDIGGSTSDILLLANRISNGNTVAHLYKQSSIRLAAGVFFKAVQNSATFRKAMVKYHNGQNKIKITNIDEITTDGKKAPFYLNSLFDQLTNDTFGLFYSSIVREAPFVYAIPAYVTGLLVYYSAKLAAKTIKDNPSLNVINKVHILPFGKGGRLFHWLKSRQSNILGSTEYYEDCFRAGFGEGAENISIIYREDITKDNKSEVAKGLSVSNNDLAQQSKSDLEETRKKSDVFAEKNVRYLENGQYVAIDELEVLENRFFENVRNFDFPEHLENFEEFLHIFVDFVGTRSGLVKNYSNLESRIPELKGKLKSFIENDTEYDKARRNKQPSADIQYRIPILIAEGLCYLKSILVPEIFKV
jgi:hypothetical protein